MYACVTYLSAALHHLVAYAEAATCVVYLATPTSHCNRKSVALCVCVFVFMCMFDFIFFRFASTSPYQVLYKPSDCYHQEIVKT